MAVKGLGWGWGGPGGGVGVGVGVVGGGGGGGKGGVTGGGPETTLHDDDGRASETPDASKLKVNALLEKLEDDMVQHSNEVFVSTGWFREQTTVRYVRVRG